MVSQFTWNNLGNLNIRDTSENIILPTILGLSIVILIPSILTILTIRLFGKLCYLVESLRKKFCITNKIFCCACLGIEEPSIKLLIFRCAYPILFCGICLVILCAISIHLIKIWLRSIRDDTYLIGKQLHNLEQEVDAL